MKISPLQYPRIPLWLWHVSQFSFTLSNCMRTLFTFTTVEKKTRKMWNNWVWGMSGDYYLTEHWNFYFRIISIQVNETLDMIRAKWRNSNYTLEKHNPKEVRLLQVKSEGNRREKSLYFVFFVYSCSIANYSERWNFFFHIRNDISFIVRDIARQSYVFGCTICFPRVKPFAQIWKNEKLTNEKTFEIRE